MNETIVCAVRGGPLSQSAIDRAVELAEERNARLVFVYVVDAEFLGYATVGRPRVILSELRSTGAFMMNILKEGLARQGVHVDYVVRTGDVRRQIIETVNFQDADVLVMGRPMKKGPRSPTFTQKSFDEFVDQVKAATGVEVVVANSTASSTEGSSNT